MDLFHFCRFPADRPYAFMLNAYRDVMQPWLRTADVPPDAGIYRVCPLRPAQSAQARVINFRLGLLLAFGRYDDMGAVYSPTIHWLTSVSGT